MEIYVAHSTVKLSPEHWAIKQLLEYDAHDLAVVTEVGQDTSAQTKRIERADAVLMEFTEPNEALEKKARLALENNTDVLIFVPQSGSPEEFLPSFTHPLIEEIRKQPRFSLNYYLNDNGDTKDGINVYRGGRRHEKLNIWIAGLLLVRQLDPAVVHEISDFTIEDAGGKRYGPATFTEPGERVVE